MKPYYEDEWVKLYHGDSDEVLPSLDVEVDAVITDPPYNVSGGDRSGREGTTLGTLKRKDGTSRKVQRDFGEWDRAWMPGPFLEQTHRLLREGGSLVAFTFREHPTQKPLWLMRAIIEQHTNEGELILDPYAGSGTTLVAAKFLNRPSVGVEMNEAYCEVIARRLAQDTLFGGAA